MQVSEITLDNKPINIIGVVGNSGSGKSTASEYFKEHLGAKVLSIDNYYKGLPEGVPGEEYNFDHPEAIDWDLLKEHLNLLAKGIGVFIRRYDFKSHSRSIQGEFLQLKNKEWLILEGTMVCVDEQITNLLSAVVYIEVNLDVCLARRITRDASRGRTPEMVHARWQRDVLPFYWEWLKPIEDKKFKWCSKVFIVKNSHNKLEDLFESLGIFIATFSWIGKH